MTDHLGSTEALADATGAIVSLTSYDSFGNTTSNIQTSYRYTGREYDPDTGLYYYRNRWYDPETGRFISEDPIGFAGGDVNLYRYVGNNPQNFVDPYGHFPDCPLGIGGFGGSGRFNGGPSSGWWDAVQLALGAAGMIPVFGEPFDLADAGISYLRGDYIGASLSMAATIPGIGNITGASKIAHRTNKLLGTARDNLLNAVQNQKLRNIVNDLYRPGAKIGSGSSMDAFRFERLTGRTVGGKSHHEKLLIYRKALQKTWKGKASLSPSDRQITKQLLRDIQNALSGY